MAVIKTKKSSRTKDRKHFSKTKKNMKMRGGVKPNWPPKSSSIKRSYTQPPKKLHTISYPPKQNQVHSLKPRPINITGPRNTVNKIISKFEPPQNKSLNYLTISPKLTKNLYFNPTQQKKSNTYYYMVNPNSHSEASLYSIPGEN